LIRFWQGEEGFGLGGNLILALVKMLSGIGCPLYVRYGSEWLSGLRLQFTIILSLFLNI